MTNLKYHLTEVSGNTKIGPTAVTTAPRATCPKSCIFMKNGCYADNFPLALHWNRVSEGKKGADFSTLATDIARLPKEIVWRWAQAGDLPGNGQQERLNKRQCLTLAQVGASRRKKPIAFSHYPMLPSHPEGLHNQGVVQAMATRGFTVTLSANNLEHADQLADLDVAPVAVVLPHEDTGKYRHTKTPAGRDVLMCPAEWVEGMTCKRCGLCAKPDHILIGFFSHGGQKKKASTAVVNFVSTR